MDIPRTNRAILACLSLIFATVSVAVYADQESLIKRDLRNDKVVVLIINSKENQESEQYADWSYYLNDFANAVGDEYVFYKLDTTSLANLTERAGSYAKAYSMIFMKQGKNTYFYDGPIVEPQVYEYVQLSYSGQTVPKHLHQFAPETVVFQFRQCDEYFISP